MTTADSAAIKERAIRTALELGAGAVRVAPAFADEESRRRMQAAFGRGDLATWGYGDDYARRASDPDDLLRGARSVLCVALPYGGR
jgi:epoxyqueuosine reductase QueG